MKLIILIYYPFLRSKFQEVNHLMLILKDINKIIAKMVYLILIFYIIT